MCLHLYYPLYYVKCIKIMLHIVQKVASKNYLLFNYFDNLIINSD